MKERYVYGSLTRKSDLSTKPFDVVQLPRHQWETGDFVVGKFLPNPETLTSPGWVELPCGRRRTFEPNDLLVGALGLRNSTKEAVGNWYDIGNDLRMQELCNSGMFGIETSHPPQDPPSPSFQYQGHALRQEKKLCMKDFAPEFPKNRKLSCKVVLIVGTSMSVGKTTAARTVINVLKEMNVGKVVGAKLSGAGHYHDVLSMLDAGADDVVDFVDIGLPSTILPPQQYSSSLHDLLSLICSKNPDIVVMEVGASPCEPYNGLVALKELAERAHFVVLCASDAYSVVGAEQCFLKQAGFNIQPNIVTGIVAATSGGCDLVLQMSGIPALSLATQESVNKLRKLLANSLVVQESSGR